MYRWAIAITAIIILLMTAGLHWQHETIVSMEAKNKELAAAVETMQKDLDIQRAAADLAAENAQRREAEIKAVRARANAVFSEERNREWGTVAVPDDVRGLLVQGARRDKANAHSSKTVR